MAFSYTNCKGATYLLHSQTTTLKNGNTQTIYFVAKAEKEGIAGCGARWLWGIRE